MVQSIVNDDPYSMSSYHIGHRHAGIQLEIPLLGRHRLREPWGYSLANQPS